MTEKIHKDLDYKDMAEKYNNEVLLNAFGTVCHCWNIESGFMDNDPEIMAYKQEILSRMRE